MDTYKPLKVAVYFRVATHEQAEPQVQLAEELLRQFLQEQEVPSCRKCKLLSQ